MSRNVLSPALRRGFPFPLGTGADDPWDNSTYVEIGTVDTGSGLFAISAPPVNEVGPGTLYPVGMNLDTVAKLLYRIRQWDVHIDFIDDGTTYSVDSVVNAGALSIGPDIVPTPPVDEADLLLRGITAPDEHTNLYGGTHIFADAISAYVFPTEPSYSSNATFWLFGPNYKQVAATMFWRFFEDDEEIGFDGRMVGFMSGFDGFYQRPRVIKRGTKYWPMISHGGISTYKLNDSFLGYLCNSSKALSGDPEEETGGNSDLDFDEETCTFVISGSGTFTPRQLEDPDQVPRTGSYEVTISPASFWTYGTPGVNARYSASTGLPA